MARRCCSQRMVLPSMTIMAHNCQLALGIVSYNMHGFNNGFSFLKELCCDPNVNIICVQEHWLYPSNLSKLSDLHEDFSAFGVSAMSKHLCAGLLRGRPYGGVGFYGAKVWHPELRLSLLTIMLEAIAISLLTADTESIVIARMYFPCFDSGNEYIVELGHCMGFVHNVVEQFKDIIVIGDMNFQCDSNHPGYVIADRLFQELKLSSCDDRINDDDKFTFVNEKLGCSLNQL